jgi:hypothetical protein
MADLGERFYRKLLEVSSSLGMRPEHILNVMGLESGFNPAAGSGSSAVGLVQIMPKYLGKLGFNGSASDFRKLPPEEQLTYIERLIRGNMNALNGGRPFKSLTQYYVSNFLPACLKKPDVQAEDPRAILAARNPTEAHIPHSTVEYERKVYAANSGLDADQDGFITFGDLTAKLAQVASKAPYREQLANMQKYTNYSAGKPISAPDIKPDKSEKSYEQEYDRMIKQFLDEHYQSGDYMRFIHQHVEHNMPTTKPSIQQPQSTEGLESVLDEMLMKVRSSEYSYKKLYKALLPTHNFAIRIFANEYVDALEYAYILSTAIEEELMADAAICSNNNNNNNNIVVSCKIQGDQDLCKATIKQFSDSVAAAFKHATIKIGGIDINTSVNINKQSSYVTIKPESTIANHRRFLMKFV